MKGGVDLNGKMGFRANSGDNAPGAANEHRQDPVRTTDDFLPWTTFARYVTRYRGDKGVRTLTCAEQFRAMAFAQLTYRESLRVIEACLLAQAAKLYPESVLVCHISSITC
jgi:hypothetical protein